jgi:hypothetical protein
LFPLIAARRLYKLTTGQQDGHDAALPSRIVNGLLYAVFATEKYVVPFALFPYGTSVLAILERDDSRACRG